MKKTLVMSYKNLPKNENGDSVFSLTNHEVTLVGLNDNAPSYTVTQPTLFIDGPDGIAVHWFVLRRALLDLGLVKSEEVAL